MEGKREWYYVSVCGEELDVATLGVAGVDNGAVPLARSGGENVSSEKV